MSREIDEIKKAAGAYRRWALEARKKYIELRQHQDPEIRGLYIRSVDRVAKELRRLVLKTPSSYLRKRQLEELEAALRAEAGLLTGGIEKVLGKYIEQAVDAGGGYSQNIVMDLLKKAGFDMPGIQTAFASVNRQAVEACWARTKKGLYLSDRIWQQGENYRSAVRDIIQEAVATGQDAVKTARMLEQYVRQGKQTLARDYPEMMKRMGGRIPGDICYEALRLARTEMTAAFGEGTLAAAQASPSYIGMKWVLSHSHPLFDICDHLAAHDEGLGEGVYAPGNEPPFPGHPNCICHLIPVHEQPEEFVKRLKKWKDEPASEPGLEKWYNSHGKGLLGSKPSVVDIEKAKTLEECQQWAKANYPHIEFEFEGAVVDTIRPTLQQFDKLAQEWPDVAEKIQQISTKRKFNKEYAHAAQNGKYIGLNPAYYGNHKKILNWIKLDAATKYHPRGCNSIEFIITHEFGHMVHLWLEEQIHTPFMSVVSADGTGLVSSTLNNWVDHWFSKKKRLVGNLSKYAMENRREAFAEVFAAHYHQKNRKGKFLRSFEVLVEEMDKKKWLSSYRWLNKEKGKERAAAMQRISELKGRLGMS